MLWLNAKYLRSFLSTGRATLGHLMDLVSPVGLTSATDFLKEMVLCGVQGIWNSGECAHFRNWKK